MVQALEISMRIYLPLTCEGQLASDVNALHDHPPPGHPEENGRQLLTFYQPTLLLAMGHAARAAGVSCAVQCVVDRLTELYLGLMQYCQCFFGLIQY